MSHHKPDPDKSVNLTIDGIPVTVPEGTRILEAALKANVHIPTLCEHPDLCKRAVCRVCVVECDGRGKLLAACANEVWEGVSVVTHNDRINNIRKTIIELLVANHPQECLSCVRSTNCELQNLAAQFGIRESPFSNGTSESGCEPPLKESETLVRDMAKCVKCGRCVEACQEIQTIRNINTSCRSVHYAVSAPYGQALADGSCVFCGHCAAVCPVGAIYEHDQSMEVWEILVDKERRTAAQISPSLCGALGDALGLPAGTINPGKLVCALKRLGFDKVFDAEYFANAAAAEENSELQNRIKKTQLPMIAGCSEGVAKFVEDSYPDLIDHLSPCKSPQQTFAALLKAANPEMAAVSVSACIARKYKHRSSAADAGITLTVKELARIFKLGGIDLGGLPETPFDIFEGTPPQAAPVSTGIKTLTVNGFANARAVLDSIRRGECEAALVKIKSCPSKN
ncbi:MAG: (2Fe-2S)-binding protein [Treponema sp.]|jgi:NADH dehydrogenase/NADH:ubiquinone oxidoreductase subunit G|nr:(2Fe-2S)-binding protein [Treponema sp.]